MGALFVVTPWRNGEELLQLRRDFYGKGDAEGGDGDGRRRQRAVDKVLAWRVRRLELPLLLDATADIVDAVLQDERNEMSHNSLRLVYATAVARFVTGFSDTQLDLRRARPSWLESDVTGHPSSQHPFLDFSPALLETRHSIVHRHLPPLAELKKAAQLSLDWLWEWYWSHLDAALCSTNAGNAGPAQEEEAMGAYEVRGKVQGALKTYVRGRKGEVKSKTQRLKRDSRAAETAVSALAPLAVRHCGVLLEALVDEKMIVPADRKMGDSMSGAFLLWSRLLVHLCVSLSTFLPTLLDRLFVRLGSRGLGDGDAKRDPTREAMSEWLVYILTSAEWEEVYENEEREQHIVRILERCFIEPTFWNLGTAGALLQHEGTPSREQWGELLRAARDEEMDIDSTEPEAAAAECVVEMKVTEVTEKLSGPQKYVGLWKPKPIGVLPTGWEDDEEF